MANKTEHALHNKKLCEELNVHKKYNDWTITTAFYSALHFTDLKVYPFTSIHGQICNNIDEAIQVLNHPEKHTVKMKMIELQCSKIKNQYRWLKEQSYNARYKTYKIPASSGDKAVQYLKEIEAYCIN
ncbi:hypothetical protein [Chryseobacterium hagamense]|uniref:HEPN domain-containing protein n=1 Tax=Chryseobacterium hagamense TaxID=395935 RepID=A0A511YQM5_9FLAO|nr:hypothetical protein [Chryseobacterium hagamense]GEN77491.1 hypothetical protein CHA01nite_32310 [Chryseobacterium hagamense]